MKQVVVSSILPADANVIWPKLLDTATLQFIARPLMRFIPLDGAAYWAEGGRYSFRLMLLGVVPFGGRHEINLVSIDKDRLRMLSREHNAIVTTWGHLIEMEPLSRGSVKYTDTVRIDAGRLTPVIAVWARVFYRHRQRRWLRLLREVR